MIPPLPAWATDDVHAQQWHRYLAESIQMHAHGRGPSRRTRHYVEGLRGRLHVLLDDKFPQASPSRQIELLDPWNALDNTDLSLYNMDLSL